MHDVTRTGTASTQRINRLFIMGLILNTKTTDYASRRINHYAILFLASYTFSCQFYSDYQGESYQCKQNCGADLRVDH